MAAERLGRDPAHIGHSARSDRQSPLATKPIREPPGSGYRAPERQRSTSCRRPLPHRPHQPPPLAPERQVRRAHIDRFPFGQPARPPARHPDGPGHGSREPRIAGVVARQQTSARSASPRPTHIGTVVPSRAVPFTDTKLATVADIPRDLPLDDRELCDIPLDLPFGPQHSITLAAGRVRCHDRRAGIEWRRRQALRSDSRVASSG